MNRPPHLGPPVARPSARRSGGRRGRFPARAAGLALGFGADAVLGDPARFHPVAGFGSVAAALERRTYADRRSAGVLHTAVLVGGTVALGVAAETIGRRHPVLGTVLTAASTWAVLGGASLAGHGTALARELTDAVRVPAEAVRAGAGPHDPRQHANDPLAAARARIPALCGRDPQSLDAAGMARAGTESMAENTSDAVVAPLFWGAVAGVPGLLGYRAINTLDAMVGYRNARYSRFGWASARLDDVANLAPARLCAALTVAVAPLVGGSPRAAAAAWRRDAGGHPSPNAGPVEASAAGALGVRLGGTTVYAHGVEERPALGAGPAPAPVDLARAARLSRLVGAAAAVVAVGAAAVIRG